MRLNLTETPKSGSKHTLTYYRQSQQHLKGNKNKLKPYTTKQTLILRSHNNNGSNNKQELIKTIIYTKERGFLFSTQKNLLSHPITSG